MKCKHCDIEIVLTNGAWWQAHTTNSLCRYSVSGCHEPAEPVATAPEVSTISRCSMIAHVDHNLFQKQVMANFIRPASLAESMDVDKAAAPTNEPNHCFKHSLFNQDCDLCYEAAKKYEKEMEYQNKMDAFATAPAVEPQPTELCNCGRQLITGMMPWWCQNCNKPITHRKPEAGSMRPITVDPNWCEVHQVIMSSCEEDRRKGCRMGTLPERDQSNIDNEKLLDDMIERLRPRPEMLPAEFNINNPVWVKLTERGEKIWAAYWMRFPELGHTGVPRECRKTDAQGRTEFQLWTLMEIFGSSLNIGFDPPFETTIYFKRAASVQQEPSPEVETEWRPCSNVVPRDWICRVKKRGN